MIRLKSVVRKLICVWAVVSVIVVFGSQTAFAKNGQEAIDKAVAKDYDVITMDINMPVLDGISAVKEIMQKNPTAILMVKYGMSFWFTIPVGMFFGIIFGILLGFPTLRVRDDYLAIVTLGFGQIVYIVANNWMGMTRGPRGIPGIPAPRLGFSEYQIVIDSYPAYYYLILLFVFITIYACVRLRDSRVGLAWMAIREDEDVAAVMGIHLVYEGYRWQMIPLYGITIGLGIFSIWRLTHPKSRVERLSMGLIAQTVGGLLILGIAIIPPIVLPVPKTPDPTGPYEIGTTTLMLADESRGELYSGKENVVLFHFCNSFFCCVN